MIRPFLGLLLPLIVAGCTLPSAEEQPSQHGGESWRVREIEAMGTELVIRAHGRDPVATDRAIDAAIEEFLRIEDLMTDWRPSELTRLNESAGQGRCVVPAELAAIVGRSLEIGRITNGAFDITYAGAGTLWDFKVRPPVVPTVPEISRALQSVGFARVGVDPRDASVNLPEGMRIGLGGIAKGYGVDRAMAVLRDHGIQHAIVNAGGDMKVLGERDGAPWQIAIRHPRDQERAMAVLSISNSCVVTSGDYERFFLHEGKRYHHIIDPRTGYPSTGCMSATIVAQNAEFADALATAVCVLGVEAGIALVEKIPKAEAICVGMDGTVHASTGLTEALR